MFDGDAAETADEIVLRPVTRTANRSWKRTWKWPFWSRRRRRLNSLSEDALELSSTVGRSSTKATDYTEANGCSENNRKHPSNSHSAAAAATAAATTTTAVTDGGYGWTVVGASFVAHVIADGCGFSFGVLFAELLDAFGESKGRTAWVGSLFVSIPAVCGPIAGVMTTRYGCRVTTIIGGLIAGVGCFASAYARSVAELCLTFGVIAGFGLSLVFVPSVVVVAFYFEKNRAFATGIAAAGSGIGTFVFAPLTEWLIERYMWRGTLIITAGILLNIVVCGALFRPFPEPQQPATGSGSGGAAAAAAAGTSSESDADGGSQRSRRRRPSAAGSDEQSLSLSRASSARPADAETEGKGREDTKMDEAVIDGNLLVTADKAAPVWMSPLGGRNVTAHGISTNGSLNGNCSHSKTACDAMNAYNLSSPKVASSPDVCVRPQPVTRNPSLGCLPSPRLKKRSSLDVSAAAMPTHGWPTCDDDLQQCARSRSLYSCVADAVDRLQHRQHPDCCQPPTAALSAVHHTHVTVMAAEAVTASASSSTATTTHGSSVVLRRRDLVHRGSLLSAGVLLSAASRRASCPETSHLAAIEARQHHHHHHNRHHHSHHQTMSGSMTVSEEEEDEDDMIDHVGSGRQRQASDAPFFADSSSAGTSAPIVAKTDGSDKAPNMKNMSTLAAIRHVFNSAVFNYFCIHTILLYVSYDIPYVYGPVRATVHGLTDSQASLLVSIIGILSTVGQIAMGYAGDQSAIDTLSFYNTMTSVAGLATLVMPAATSFPALAVLNAAYGFFISANFALTTVILVELVGVERLTDAYGIVSLAQGVANLVGPPLAGWLSDTTGSFDLAFYGAGAIICLSGLMLFVAPCLARCDPSLANVRRRLAGDDDSGDVSTTSGTCWRKLYRCLLPWKSQVDVAFTDAVIVHRMEGGESERIRCQPPTIDIVVTGDNETGRIIATELVRL